MESSEDELRKVGQIQEQLGRLDAAINKSRESQEALIERLSPVLRFKEDNAKEKPKELPQLAPLADDLRQLADTITICNKDWEDVLARLEL